MDRLGETFLSAASDKVAHMFETVGDASADVLLDARAVTRWISELRGLATDVTDAERIDQLRALEGVKAAAAAAQARIAVDLDASQRATQAAAGVSTRLQGRGVAAQIGLARRESPNRGAHHLGLGKVLVAEMPTPWPP